jgi:hypothetical protein
MILNEKVINKAVELIMLATSIQISSSFNFIWKRYDFFVSHLFLEVGHIINKINF